MSLAYKVARLFEWKNSRVSLASASIFSGLLPRSAVDLWVFGLGNTAVDSWFSRNLKAWINPHLPERVMNTNITIAILIHRKVLASRFMKVQHVRHDVCVCVRLSYATCVRKER